MNELTDDVGEEVDAAIYLWSLPQPYVAWLSEEEPRMMNFSPLSHVSFF